MTWDLTRNASKEPSLAEMTSKSIELLQEYSRNKEKGFLLFVEGGRIDHGHHEGRAKVIMSGTKKHLNQWGLNWELLSLGSRCHI